MTTKKEPQEVSTKIVVDQVSAQLIRELYKRTELERANVIQIVRSKYGVTDDMGMVYDLQAGVFIKQSPQLVPDGS